MNIPLAAEPIWHLGNFVVTNAMLNAYIAVAFFILIALIASRRKSLVPKGIHNIIETLIEFALSEIDKVTGDKRKTRLFLPLVATIFFFVLFSNWLGQIPGTGSIGVWGMMHGELELIPLLRPATSDLNLTLAIALVAVISTHLAGLLGVGVINHVSKFFNVRGIFQAFKHGPMAVVIAIIGFFVGLLELVGELAQPLSLSLRLFGNNFAGEVLMAVMLSLASYVVPIPFIFLELLVGVIQATVFSMLTLAFLVVATMQHGHEEEEAHDGHEAVKGGEVDTALAA